MSKNNETFVINAIDDDHIGKMSHKKNKFSWVNFTLFFWLIVIGVLAFLVHKTLKLEKKISSVNELLMANNEKLSGDAITELMSSIKLTNTTLAETKKNLVAIKKDIASNALSLDKLAANFNSTTNTTQSKTEELQARILKLEQQYLALETDLNKLSESNSSLISSTDSLRHSAEKLSKTVSDIKFSQKEHYLKIKGLEENIISLQNNK